MAYSTFGALYTLDKTRAIELAVDTINKHEGDLTASARALRIGRNTLLRFIAKSETLRSAVKAVREAHGWRQVNGRWYMPGAVG
jgi:hypothetical protein